MKRKAARYQWRYSIFFTKSAALIWATAIYNLLFFYLNSPIYAFTYSPKTVMDDYIPLIPLFIIPYLSYHPYPYISLLMFSLKKKNIFPTTLYASWVVLSVSFICFYFFPTMIVRPDITQTDIFSELIKWLYAVDYPYAALPSLHAGLTTVAILGWNRMKNDLDFFMILWGIAIIVSTVLVKQHYFLDIVAGVSLGAGSFFLVAKYKLKS